MKWKSLASAAVMAAGALAIGALLGGPGSASAAPSGGTPTISGTPEQGATLTANHGTWSTSSTPTYTYTWQRCNSSGASCSPISGATNLTTTTYSVVAADVGSTLRVEVTVTDSSGSATATSAATAIVSNGSVPTNSQLPTISGVPQEGATLTANPGTWNNSPTSYAYSWGLCDQNGNNCSAISGATNTTYTLVANDVTHTLRVTVIATNSSGNSAPSTSVPTAVVSSASAPNSTAPPKITGTMQVGSTLTTTKGTWSNSVTSYAYAWERCDQNGNSCAAISGATSTTYKLTQADAGTTLRVTVTATNSAGSTAVTSDPTPLLAAPVTVTTGCPSGKGTIQIKDLTPPARLRIGSQTIVPSTVPKSASTIQLRFRVTACGGRPVQGATVFAVPIPYNQFRGKTGTTGVNGTVTLNEPRLNAFPATRQQRLLAVLLRASKPGESTVSGVSTRIIVSFRVRH